jgi:hypothetical protein
MRRPFLLAALLLPHAAASAQTIRGVGARPCAEWSQARHGGGRDYEAEQWVLGYLSGVNAGATAHGGALLTGNEGTIFAEVDNYCGSHQADMIWAAVKAYLAMSRAS